MKIVAFDPGKVASWAAFDTLHPWLIQVGEVELCGVGRMLRPCPVDIGSIIADADQVLVEEVGAMTKQGVSSMFTFGMSVGAILNAVGASGKPLETVRPQEWKAASRLGGLKDIEAKRAAQRYARELWPQQAACFRATTKHGMAEAALMARWYFVSGAGRHIPLEADCPMRAPAPSQRIQAV